MLDLSALFMSSALKGKELKEYGFFFFTSTTVIYTPLLKSQKINL